MRIPTLARLIVLLARPSLLAGCTVGPKYERPNVIRRRQPFAVRTIPAIVSDAKNSLGDEQWATVYREPELQALIRKALANNYDVRIAAQRILEQQAQVQITRVAAVSDRNRRGHGYRRHACRRSLGTQIPEPARGSDRSICRLRGRRISGASIASRRKLPALSCWHRPGRSAPSAHPGAAGGDRLPATARARPRNSRSRSETLKVRQDSVDLDKAPGERRLRASVRSAAGGTTALHCDLGNTPA